MSRAAPSRATRAASWIAEAVSTGNALAALPEGMAPRDRAEGERAAFLVLEHLGIAPCGVRVVLDARRVLAGPMVGGRLHRSGAALAGLRHPRATAAVVGVLATGLEPGEEGDPPLSAVHPALDVADSRFGTAPRAVAVRAADLGGLGHVVVGKAVPPSRALVVAGAEGAVRVAVPEAFREAAAAARRLGGLPAGGLLVVAGLAPLAGPGREGWVEAGFGSAGAVRARLAAPAG